MATCSLQVVGTLDDIWIYLWPNEALFIKKTVLHLKKQTIQQTAHCYKCQPSKTSSKTKVDWERLGQDAGVIAADLFLTVDKPASWDNVIADVRQIGKDFFGWL